MKATVAKGQSIFDAAVPVEDLDYGGYKFLIFGQSFTGKTTLACSFPKPALLIRPEEVEDGSLTVRNIKGVSVSPFITDPDQILEICDRQKETRRYKTIILDGATRMQDLVVKKYMNMQDVPVQQTWGLVPQADWNGIGIIMKEFIRALYRLAEGDTHVVLVADEKVFGVRSSSTEEGGGSAEVAFPTVMAAMTPSITGFLHNTTNYAVHSFKRMSSEIINQKIVGEKTAQTSVESGRMVFGVHVGEVTGFATKFRLPRGKVPPQELMDPSFDKLDRIYRGA